MEPYTFAAGNSHGDHDMADDPNSGGGLTPAARPLDLGAAGGGTDIGPGTQPAPPCHIRRERAYRRVLAIDLTQCRHVSLDTALALQTPAPTADPSLRAALGRPLEDICVFGSGGD